MFIKISQAIKRRGEWESLAGQAVSWSIDFCCLITGFVALRFFDPELTIGIIVVAMVFWCWWASAYVGRNSNSNCLIILVILGVNIAQILALLGKIKHH